MDQEILDFSECPIESGLLYKFDSRYESWESSEVSVRIEKKPFGKGLTRQAYRLCLLSLPPSELTEDTDWSKAVVCVGKSANTDDGEIETDCDKAGCFDSVRLQNEAVYWGGKFNIYAQSNAVSVKMIDASVLELCDRPNMPVISCENMIEGSNKEKLDFAIYNSSTITSNLSPLAYFMFSFYASQGTTIVVHTEGADGIYTNPQIHSVDCKFGAVDSGRRGMAMFLANFDWNLLCDELKLPRFKLSMKEEERIAKRIKQANRPKRVKKSTSRGVLSCGFESTSSNPSVCDTPVDLSSAASSTPTSPRLLSPSSSTGSLSGLSGIEIGCAPQIRREDDLFLERKLVSDASFTIQRKNSKPVNDLNDGNEKDAALPLMSDEVEEVQRALLKVQDYVHRVTASAFIRDQPIVSIAGSQPLELFDKVVGISEEVVIENIEAFINISCDELSNKKDSALFLQRNIAEVHLELAKLEGVGQFANSSCVRFGSAAFSAGTGGCSDISSCIFHLCEACVLGSCAAALSLARLHYGLETAVQDDLLDYVPKNLPLALELFVLAAHRGSISALSYAGDICTELEDFERAIMFYRMALHAFEYDTVKDRPQSETSVVIHAVVEEASNTLYTLGEEVEANYLGCDSWYAAEVISVGLGEYRVRYTDGGEEETVSADKIRATQKKLIPEYCVGDEVEVNYLGCDTWYAAQVVSVNSGDSAANSSYTVRYTDGGEEETVTASSIRSVRGGCKSIPSADQVEDEEDKRSNESDCSTAGSLREANTGGLVTPLFRLGMGGDNAPHLCTYELLARIGNAFRKLHERSSSKGFEELNIISASLMASILDPKQEGQRGDVNAADHWHAEAVSYYNDAIVCAMNEGKNQTAESYINICSQLEGHI